MFAPKARDREERRADRLGRILLRARQLVGLALLLCCLPAAVPADRSWTLKFATLAPEGSTWMKLITDWADRVDKESGGRLKFKLYPGGVTGDEPDVLLKMRFGQLQGTAITGHGIGLIYSPARVLEIPFLFQSYDEVDAVRNKLSPELSAGFRQHGFELVGWLDVGFVRYFSKSPVHSIDDLRRCRIWLWQGDPLAEAFFTVSGLPPVPLSITEVFTGLSTGLIDTVYAPPLAAIAMQWFTLTPYVSDVAMTDGIGALVIDRRFFDKLPKDLQALLTRTGQETAQTMIRETRQDNEKSLTVLKDYGLKFVQWKKGDEKQVLDLRDRAAALLAKQGYIPADLFQRVRKMLEDYRSSKASRASTAP
jgi:TRAP-type C4-dicarboxylate transport system substrate-binding protein